MPSPRDLAIARIRAARDSRPTTPRTTTAPAKLPVPAASAGRKLRPLRRYGEKRTLAFVVAFIAALVLAGVIYSTLSTGPPEKPVKESTLQVPAPVRIARILLPGVGPLCREILFDNDTGYFSLEKSVSCDSAPPAQARSGNSSGGGSGFSSFKEAFGRKS